MSGLDKAIDMLVSESSGLPVDKVQVFSIVDKTISEFYKKYNNQQNINQQLGEVGTVLSEHTARIKDAAGTPRTIHIKIVVGLYPSATTLIARAHFEFIGEKRLYRNILISLNGVLTWGQLFKEKKRLKAELRSSLSHEMAHAADPFLTKDRKAQDKSRFAGRTVGNRYTNLPAEVRAIVVSVRADVEELRIQAIRAAVSDFPMWVKSQLRETGLDFGTWLRSVSRIYERIADKLTDENRKYVLSKTYAYLFGGQQ